MPHLRFETTVEPDDRATFAEWVAAEFASVMETGTGHVGVAVRVCDRSAISLGRAASDEDVVLVDADVRTGRSEEQRRTLSTSIIERISEEWDVAASNVYLVYTGHDGRDFHLAEGALASWDETEAGTGPTRDTG